MDRETLERLAVEFLDDVPWSEALPPSAFHAPPGMLPITEKAKEEVLRALQMMGDDLLAEFNRANAGREVEAARKQIHNFANLRALKLTLELAKACRE